MATIANLMKLTESLQTEVKAMRAEIAGLRAEPTKAAKAKKEVDPDAPPKETSWWIKATQHVRGVLKASIESDNAIALASGGKKLAGTVPVMVASMLKTAGQLGDGLMPEDAQILEAYEAFKVDPPAPKKAVEASSVASAASAASKGSKFADLSEEEKTAARKASAAKAAATRKANKAAEIKATEEKAAARKASALKGAATRKANKAAASAEASEASASEPDMDMPFMLNGKSYLRIENNLWDAATDAWVGAYDPKTKAIDPFAEEPERMEA